MFESPFSHDAAKFYAFTNFRYTVLFQMSINLTEQFGIFLRVRGGLDIVNGRALWDFQSIDPDTGVLF